MTTKIHYDIHSCKVRSNKESLSLTCQWEQVLQICREKHLDEFARTRLAFNMVDYITSEDLPFRLFVTRAPQAMAAIAEETVVYKEHRTINGKQSGMVYSRNEQIIPKDIVYMSEFMVTRKVNGLTRSLSMASLTECLKAGDIITPLDGILFLNCKRITSNISQLKKKEASLIPTMKRIEVSDSFTGTSRRMASYTLG
ncbi:hypothetical protein ACPV54_26005 [Vibrio mediterranei]